MVHNYRDKSTKGTWCLVLPEVVAAAAVDEDFGGDHRPLCNKNSHRPGWWCWLEEELAILKKGREEFKTVKEIAKVVVITQYVPACFLFPNVHDHLELLLLAAGLLSDVQIYTHRLTRKLFQPVGL